MKIINILLASIIVLVQFGCKQEKMSPAPASPVYNPAPQTQSFLESFDNVGELTSKGWAFKNNSEPVGQSGWRQGRYEAVNSANYKFPDAFIGFPAYRANTSPNDFVSADASAVNDVGNISAWLITKQINIKNGDSLEFWTRAVNDENYPVYVKDRLQVRLATDGSTNVGNTATSVGSFTTLLRDINPNYVNNSGTTPGGYPYKAWTRFSVVFSGLPGGSVRGARVGFRYMGTNAGAAGPNYAGVCGIDELRFFSIQ